MGLSASFFGLSTWEISHNNFQDDIFFLPLAYTISVNTQRVEQRKLQKEKNVRQVHSALRRDTLVLEIGN